MIARHLWLIAWSCLVPLAACDSGATEPKPVPAVAEPETPEAPKEQKTGPRLAKDHFQPYVPKAKKPLDFSGVDVGDEPMANAPVSMEALGEAIVEALNAGDSKALAALAVSEREYEDRFFPITIHHESGLGLGAELAWAELHGESQGDMNTALERYGKQKLEFVRFESASVEERPKVKLHRRPKLVVKNEAGEEQTLIMLGSILEHTPSGGCKVLAFRDTP